MLPAMRLTSRRLVLSGASVLLGVFGLSAPAAASGPTLQQLIGQKLVVTMSGLTPHATLLDRIRHGEVGGIALLGSNVSSPTQLRALTAKLQQAARDGGQPPLLIAIDQEGGEVKRISWAPPTQTVPQMGANGSVTNAWTQGRKTGKALLRLGINTDLAPVADVPVSTSSFMYQQGRVFGFDADETANLADAFARGLVAAGDNATMKHFPGIGLAIQNTDDYADTITASYSGLEPGLRPYRKAISHHVPLIMLSNATYTAWDSDNAAGWSPYIIRTLLRQTLGFQGVSITDSLTGTAHSRGVTLKSLASKSCKAGADMILASSSEHASAGMFRTLLKKAQNGAFDHDLLLASYNRIMALKARLSASAGESGDGAPALFTMRIAPTSTSLRQ
jgi:beta-N-acetylhexosaminidase